MAYGDFEDKYYESIFEDEELLYDGNLLRDGMRVLIEDPEQRQFIHEQRDMTYHHTDRARVRNRWCVVHDPRVVWANNQESTVHFVGIYDDGTRRKRIHDISLAWIVKKDSIPSRGIPTGETDALEESFEKKFETIMNIILHAMLQGLDNDRLAKLDVTKSARKAAKEILKISW